MAGFYSARVSTKLPLHWPGLSPPCTETAAITRYVDEAFPGPALQPAEVRDRARMAQVIALADHHLHGPPAMRLLWRAMYGSEANGGPLAETAAEEDRPAAEHALDLVEGLIGPGAT